MDQLPFVAIIQARLAALLPLILIFCAKGGKNQNESFRFRILIAVNYSPADLHG